MKDVDGDTLGNVVGAVLLLAFPCAVLALAALLWLAFGVRL